METERSTETKTEFSPVEMMHQAEIFALSKVSKPPGTLFGLSVMAGLFIGLGFVFYLTVTTGSEHLGWGMSHLLGGLAFSIGLIMVVISGAELFTSTVLTVITRANQQINNKQMLGIWLKVFIGNLVGAALLVALVLLGGLHLLDHGQWGLSALKVAQHKLHHTPLQAFTLGVLCNMLVCQAIWMTFSSKDMLAKALLVILPVALFVSTGFEHSVANLFMVPLGIMLVNTVPAEFWLQVGAEAQQFADLTWSHFLLNNLLPVILGNIVGGGVLIGMGYWYIYQYPALRKLSSERKAELIPPTEGPPTQSHYQLQQVTVSRIMQRSPLTLKADLPVNVALKRLLENDLTGAPVVDGKQRLLGMFSAQDMLVELWRSEHTANPALTVNQLMQQDIPAISPSDSLAVVAELMGINHEDLAAGSGISPQAVDIDTLSVIERTKSRQGKQLAVYPVVLEQRLVGVVARYRVIQELQPYYDELIAG